MALIRVAQYNSTPTVVTDYQAQNAHLQAFTNQLLTQQFILDSGTAQPVIKQGCYVSHGGSLYVADADTSITGSPSDGSVYIRVSGTTSLTVEFVTDISGYTWNPVYTALTSGSYTLLPYLIVKASAVWTRYNFNPNNQVFGEMKATSLDTGHGANELYAMNQNVRTTDSPTFVTVNATDVVTTNGPNKPVDNNDASMPSVGIGGFSYATASVSASVSTEGDYPSITIGSGGTWVYIALSTRSDYYWFKTKGGRIAGGSSVQGDDSATSDLNASVQVIAWRIA
jgi:hypothetical protein